MTTQAKTLYTIEGPDKTRSPQDVGREIISLYRKEFSFTGAKLCRLFDCDRAWVANFLRPNVRHIRITVYFRRYILDTFHESLSESEREDFASAYYFYSASDLTRFWHEAAAAKRKKALIDLATYLAPNNTISMLIKERQTHDRAKRSKEETTRHLAAMERLLNTDGYSLYLASKYQKADWQPVSLPELPDKLLTTRRIMIQKGFRTDGTAYKYLMGMGAIHMKFGNKTYWLIEPCDGEWLIAVPLN